MQKNETDVLYVRTQSLVEIGGRTATGDEKQSFFCLYVCLYVCMFVTLDVQERDPTIELDKKIYMLCVCCWQLRYSCHACGDKAC